MGDSQDSQKAQQALYKINRDLEEKVATERAKELKLPYVDVARFPINPDILRVLPEEAARKGLVMPFYKSGKNIRLAVADPASPEFAALRATLEAKEFLIEVYLASRASIEEAYRHYASAQYKPPMETKNVIGKTEIHYEKELENVAKLKDTIATLSAPDALNALHVSAIKSGASDIHYQPEETSCLLRFRIDGVLHDVFELNHETYQRLTDQLKYQANMKLNTAQLPQDGRFRFLVNDREVAVRVSSLPTPYGESFVCRVLDSDKEFNSFEELGFSGRPLELLHRAVGIAQGMVLVTGPTSSGKTTTLYVLLIQLNKPESKIITLEDPIEYRLHGITQSQVDEKRGYDFPAGLRAILRQDPNIVMVGEIRDRETAEVAVQAALTGHLLISTLHTNSAVEATARLMTMGVPAFMIAPALALVVAQRLVRRLCTCHAQRDLTDVERALFEKKFPEMAAVLPGLAPNVPTKLSQSKGCEQCSYTGFRGQMVVAEALEVDDEIEAAIAAGKSSPEIFAMVRKKGMLTMEEDGLLKVAAGSTTLEEVHRVTNA